ncbi:MAG: hypothetical protein JXA03_16915 [Bacteroidales bacterium]|nr:hypothetical protein [Bacteroidales bacterium]
MSAKRKIIILLPLTLSLIFIFKISLPEPEENTASKDHFWTAKTHSRKKYNVLAIGDSRTYRGISPKSISQQLNGLTVVNLGYSSAGFDSVYLGFVQSRLREKGAKIILIGVTPYSLTPEASQNYHYKSLANLKKPDIFRNLYLNAFLRHVNPYKSLEIRNFIAGNSNKKGYFMEYKPEGWVASRKIPANPEEALSSYVKNFENNKVSPKNTDYFLQRVKQWCDDGIYVFGYRVPTTDKMEALEDSISGVDFGYIKNSVILAGGHWIELNNNDFESYDGSHLHYTSAEKLSCNLGQEIGRILALRPESHQ